MIRGRALLGLIALTMIWGVNWPIMKFSLRELSPLYFRALTMSGGALLLALFYSARGTDFRLPRPTWLPVVWLALPNIFGWHLFSILGVQELASGRAAILGFTMPIWTTLLAVAFFNERLTGRVAFSAACALAAVGLLLMHELTALAGKPRGVLWMQIAALSWALGTILMRRTRLPLPTTVITVWMMGLSAVVFWLVAALAEPLPSWHFSPLMWAALAWGAAINYGVAQIFWFGLARDLPPTASAFSIMAVPIIGILTAIPLVGELPRWQDFAAALFVIAAIAGALLGRAR
ncbi:MAG: DMT family transporter [Gemmatimonadota bacterium]